ncbi:MAG: nicotinate-nicotinamide nucleotide adenylyltransferase [Myxococcota bacterium]
MRIALFGGSFDPPHVAHQMAALWAIATARADRVLWVPCHRHAFGKQLAEFHDRFEMCVRAAAFLGERGEVSRVEEQIGGESRTLMTLLRLREERRGASFTLLIGADLVEERTRWAGYDEISRIAQFLVIGRQGAPRPGQADSPPLPAVSSTSIRARISRGEDVSQLVPAAVLDHVRARGLYGWRT